MPKLIIVESPNKVSKVRAYAGPGYLVTASVGHITKLADTRSDQLGFEIVCGEVEIDFHPNGARGKKTISTLKALAKKCDEIILATDPDREGEAIAWHCADQVARGKKISRITYTEVTQTAIQKALQNKRQIDMDLVYAQMSRQVLDKWIGYKFSCPLQNATNGKCRSVGRVQSAALAILVQLEKSIEVFEPKPYWSLKAVYAEGLSARFIGEDSAALSIDSDDCQISDAGGDNRQDLKGIRIWSQSEADRLVAIAQANSHVVVESSSNLVSINPPPPLTTSSLQQLAGRKLGYSSDKTMKIAQQLFEGGFITYHRTDSVSLSDEFCDSVRAWLTQHFPQLVPQHVMKHRSKANAQGAHEAIRPTDAALTPDQFENAQQRDLYALIWQRAIASQCVPARLNKTKIVIQAGATYWGCMGQIVSFAGYTTIFNNLKDEEVLPLVADGQRLSPTSISHCSKLTSPPSRLSEPQLVAELEKKGIGRPSTYASIMKVLRVRQYVESVGGGKQKKLKPTTAGKSCHTWLETALPFLINANFTAKMEKSLDLIAVGQLDWEQYLKRFEQTVISPSVTTIERLYPGSFERRQDKEVLTNYVCTICNQPLKLVRYQKGRETKKMLKCSQDAAHPVYFGTRTGTFWNPGGVDLIEKEQSVHALN